MLSLIALFIIVIRNVMFVAVVIVISVAISLIITIVIIMYTYACYHDTMCVYCIYIMPAYEMRRYAYACIRTLCCSTHVCVSAARMCPPWALRSRLRSSRRRPSEICMYVYIYIYIYT